MVQGEGNDGSDWGRGDFERMRLLPKFRFLRFLSRFIVHKRREWGKGWGACSMVNSCELGQTQRAEPALHAWGLRVWGLPEPFGGLRYAFICVSISFLLRISFGLYFFFVRLGLFRLLFCFVSLAKKHFNLQMRNKFQTKAQSFPLQINF